MGIPISIAEAQHSLTPLTVDYLESSGLLDKTGDHVSARVGFQPYGTALFLHDFPAPRGLTTDHVLGIGAASRTLAALTPRLEQGLSLDVGTGGGFQAILAAQHVALVIASDINPRALALASLNAKVNEVANVQFVRGDFLAPFPRSRFELIVANPPFVISPDVTYLFRDHHSGGSVSERVVSDAAERLTEGGFGVILCNWGKSSSDDWDEAPRRWVHYQGCDAWILCFEQRDPLTYALTWNQFDESSRTEQVEETIDRWLRFYRQNKIDDLISGAIIIQRRSGDNWIRSDRASKVPGRSAGEQVKRAFKAMTAIKELRHDDQLLNMVFAFDGSHSLHQEITYRDGQHAVKDCQMTLDDGVGLTVNVDPNLLQLLLLMDGRTPLREILVNLREGSPAITDLARRAVDTVRDLYALGFISPK